VIVCSIAISVRRPVGFTAYGYHDDDYFFLKIRVAFLGNP